MKNLIASLLAFFTALFGAGQAPQIALIDKPFDRYSIESLSQARLEKGEIVIEGGSFSFEFNPNLDKKTKKKTTGQIFIPEGRGPFPIVVMFRGYVDQEIYETGMGTSRAAKVFSEAGFITISPDFLGYGGGDKEAENIFEARFQTYTTALSLLASLDSIKAWDGKNIFIWGHSNGGQIALTALEILDKDYPTTLWAPVSKPFPYSVLYYTDEAEDKGKLIRRELAKFEDQYDTDLYSIHKYLDRVNSPLQIHQGTLDDAVPKDWSDELVKTLEENQKEVEYFVYPATDHNMKPSWSSVVQRDLLFFRKHLME